MPNDNRKYDINFNVLLDKDCDDSLIALAAETSVSKAHVIRDCIRDRYRMAFARSPTCADGQKCRCPHAHIYAPPPSVADPDEGRSAAAG